MLFAVITRKKPDFIKVKQTSSKDPSADNKIASRLVEKLSPYNERYFKMISSRAFLSAHIREILFEWETDPSKPINITEASNEVIDNSNIPNCINGTIQRLLIK